MLPRKFQPFALLTVASILAACTTAESDTTRDAGADASDASLADTSTTPPPVEAGGCNDEQGQDPEACPSTSDAASMTCFQYAHGQCVAYRTMFKRRPASSAVSCLLSLSETDSCGEPGVDCGIQALSRACDDPAANDPCNLVVSICGAVDAGANGDDSGLMDSGSNDSSAMDGSASDGSANDASGDASANEAGGGVIDAASPPPRRSGTTFTECKSFLNGLSSAGRDKMQSCMVSSCGYIDCPDGGTGCGGGLKACFALLGGALPQ
jgi:hypothetical protein